MTRLNWAQWLTLIPQETAAPSIGPTHEEFLQRLATIETHLSPFPLPPPRPVIPSAPSHEARLKQLLQRATCLNSDLKPVYEEKKFDGAVKKLKGALAELAACHSESVVSQVEGIYRNLGDQIQGTTQRTKSLAEIQKFLNTDLEVEWRALAPGLSSKDWSSLKRLSDILDSLLKKTTKDAQVQGSNAHIQIKDAASKRPVTAATSQPPSGPNTSGSAQPNATSSSKSQVSSVARAPTAPVPRPYSFHLLPAAKGMKVDSLNPFG